MIVILRFSDHVNGARFVIGKCDCGIERRFRLKRLINGRTKSCGCSWKSDQAGVGPGLHRCANCREVKSLSEYHKNKNRKESWCRACKKRHARSPKGRRRQFGSTIKYQYGITVEQYYDLILSQKNKCALCRKPLDVKSVIDHNHKTKKVRGLLCRQCNTGLGLFGDSSKILRRAINYIEMEGV